MNQNWFSDISWYGNFLELLGALVGILQYLGAEKIESAAKSFDLRNENNFEKVGKFHIPVERNLAMWLRDKTTSLSPLWKAQKTSYSFWIIAILSLMVGMFLDLGIKTEALRIVGQIMTAFIVISLTFLFLPFIFYAISIIFITLYIAISIFSQLLIYIFLSIVASFLRLTASNRTRIIYISVAVAIFGLFLQVLGPLFDFEIFLQRIREITSS